MADHWGPKVTHVVASLNARGQARRTAKYLGALLSGAWVVGAAWAAACLEAGAPVDEAAFEAAGDTAGFGGGPARGRDMAAAAARGEGGGGGALLAGAEVYLAGGRRDTRPGVARFCAPS